ncbi:TOMM precursor leader peptide-binding protein [Sorangium sp. So ce362]|uniref:TOMM precursor leader peptide-binding protein n=1 Tax=Sorangium sp. So ce362 TaxID=3133303 RepID=UPI003F5D6424
MPRILQFKHHLRVEPAGDKETVFLIGERERFMLRGRVYGLLGPLLDGRRTEDELVSALDGEVSGVEVRYALMRLEQRGYLAEAAPAPEVAGFWQALGVDAGRAAERLASTPVAVRAAGGEDPQALAGALAEAGVVVQPEAPIVALATGDYLDAGLDAWNRRALREVLRWVPVKPGGVEPWMGPMFCPGAGPCWACLAHRLRHNRPVEAYLERRRGGGDPLLPPRVALPAGRRAALGLAAVLLARWIAAGGAGPLDDRLYSLDLACMRLAEHPVERRPQCPACGDPEGARARALAPVTLASRPKRFTDDGGHRAVPPDATIARVCRQVSPSTGLVASVGPLEGRDHPLRPVYAAVYRACPAGDAPAFGDFHRASSGKGRTPAQARASALCEAIERYSATYHGDAPLRRARLAELGGDGIPPDALQHVSEAQLRAAEAGGAQLGRARDPRQAVSLPYDPAAAIDWAPAWSLTHGRRRYLPAAACYLHLPAASGEPFCSFDSNGHAAGNCIEEAIVQGFLELVERDAVALWWYNRARRPAVDLASFGEPYFDALEAHYRDLGQRLWVLDVTTDLGIPAFVAVARTPDTARLTLGFGCHHEARLGVQRALTELNQLFDPSGLGPPRGWDRASLAGEPYLFPAEAVPARTRGDYPYALRDDLRDDVNDCVARAARVGLETVVLDQTRPDTGLCVVKVAVPGLRHFWPRFGPGRLYDVPVRLGWLDRANREGDLNPVPLHV